MRRIMISPLLHFHEPFLPFFRSRIVPQWQLRLKNHEPQCETQQVKTSNDPHQIFEQFFKEHEPKTEEQKEFFKKHYPEKVQQVYDPFKILEINKNASLQQIKEAYRKLALKYHPKNNTTAQASAKFTEISKAYQNIMQSKRTRDFGDFGINNFFKDFEKQVDEVFNVQKGTESKQTVANKEIANNKNDNFGQLYSQSSHYQTLNGRQIKYVVQKVYKNNGQLLNVRRQQKLKDDGKVQITQTFDNGKQVKKKIFIQDKGTKQIN